jgi:acyl phosphate:glycerol-3-phosphate acyltransferase
MLVPLLIAAIAGYLFGALPFGYLVARSKGINIFEHGSKNPGATNVRRVLGEKFGPAGKKLGNLVFILDAVKGAAAGGWMLIAAKLGVGGGAWDADTLLWMQVVGVAASLVGHCFSCFTGFRGGKGVATTVGGILVLMPIAIGIATLVWVLTFYSSRYVSLASILAALALPISAVLLGRSSILIGLSIAIALFVVVRHRANISRLLNGTENRFVKKTAATTK